ncbi:MAG: hypothetical protein F6K14_30145 [Symploca sp. SIO2C1]|nr:hypothetical protein [Symploca sp. SIO2C1]
MRSKNILIGVIVIAVLFIGIGDRILPQPLSDASKNTRTTINQFLINLFPTRKPKNPYEEREKQLEELEQGQK